MATGEQGRGGASVPKSLAWRLAPVYTGRHRCLDIRIGTTVSSVRFAWCSHCCRKKACTGAPLHGCGQNGFFDDKGSLEATAICAAVDVGPRKLRSDADDYDCQQRARKWGPQTWQDSR